jgi:hypothetical protein
MAKALSGSEKYYNPFKPRQFEQFTANNSEKHAPCPVSDFYSELILGGSQ